MTAPTFVRPLTPAEHAEIERLVRRERDPRVVRRALMVRLSARRKTCREIAETIGVSLPTAHRVIEAFNARGIAGLQDRPRSGRPSKATPTCLDCLREAARRSPRDLGYPFDSWTLPRLQEYLAWQCQVGIHPGSLGRLMAKHGIQYARHRRGGAGKRRLAP